MPLRLAAFDEKRHVLGLALSGGGLRASFFHAGVLARLAETGWLRRVSVISTVSGGSIIGALYYLYLKRLLESKPDERITDGDYADLVAEMYGHFLRATQANIRMRTFLNPWRNLKMVRPDYSRSDRIGELYDELIFRPAAGPGQKGPIRMRDLRIRPAGCGEGFHPLRHNRGRACKVPILLINAASLNTGRNWRFEAARMGEPPRAGEADFDIDKAMRLERPRSYEELPPRLANFTLGKAVAASACVPGLFPPLAISGLYPGVRVQLVDGGVHDNQGLQALFDHNCSHFIVSDASGQLEGEADPGVGAAAALARSNAVFMQRIRSEQLHRLYERAPTDRRILLHLKKGLPPERIAPGARREGGAAPASSRPQVLLPWRTHPEAQALLAKVRTDLDAFHDVEAFALSCNGYQMCRSLLEEREGAAEAPRPVRRWRFLSVAPWLARPTPAFLRLLRAAAFPVGKVFLLDRKVAVLTGLLALAAAGAAAFGMRAALPLLVNRPSLIGALAAGAVVGLLSRSARIRAMWRALSWANRPSAALARLVMQSVLPAAGSLFAWATLGFYLPLYLRLGRLERLGSPPEDGGAAAPPAVEAPPILPTRQSR